MWKEEENVLKLLEMNEVDRNNRLKNYKFANSSIENYFSSALNFIHLEVLQKEEENKINLNQLCHIIRLTREYFIAAKDSLSTATETK